MVESLRKPDDGYRNRWLGCPFWSFLRVMYHETNVWFTSISFVIRAREQRSFPGRCSRCVRLRTQRRSGVLWSDCQGVQCQKTVVFVAPKVAGFWWNLREWQSARFWVAKNLRWFLHPKYVVPWGKPWFSTGTFCGSVNILISRETDQLSLTWAGIEVQFSLEHAVVSETMCIYVP